MRTPKQWWEDKLQTVNAIVFVIALSLVLEALRDDEQAQTLILQAFINHAERSHKWPVADNGVKSKTAKNH
jgi:hypothetical protein